MEKQNHFEENEYRELEQELKRLEEVKKQKLQVLSRLKEEEEFLEADSYLGKYRKVLFHRLPLCWLDSVYVTESTKLSKLVNASFQSQIIEHIVDLIIREKHSPVFTMALLCI